MWYTKNFIKTAQLTTIEEPADDATTGQKIKRYNYYVNAINKNLTNKNFLTNLYNNINSESDDRFDQTNGKTQLLEAISHLLNMNKETAANFGATNAAATTGAQGTTNTPGALNVENIKTTISNFLIPKNIQSHDPNVTFSEGNYFVNLKLQTNQPGAPILPYGFNFKTQEELTARLNSVAEYLNRPITQQNGQPSQNLSQQQQKDAANQTENNEKTEEEKKSDLEIQIKGSGNSAQPLELISPKTSDGKFRFYVKDLNSYNELVNNLILTITVTPNDQEKYFRSIAVTPQLNNPNISNAAKNTIAEMINQIKNEAIYQLAKDNSGKLIPSVNIQSDFEPVQATNYQNVAFPIEVPAARDGAVDIFIDGQKIASIKNNSQFILNPQKYPLFAGSHTLEAKVAGMMNTPERPVSDRFLKVLSKVRKYDFQVMSDGSIKFQNSSNDIDSFKPAENYAGSGLASKVPTNTMNLLADQIEVQNEEAIEVFLKDQDRNIPTIINNWKNKLRTLPMEEYTNKDKRKELLRNEITLFFQNEAKTRVSPGNNTLAPDDTP
jgi:hypothetical protein